MKKDQLIGKDNDNIAWLLAERPRHTVNKIRDYLRAVYYWHAPLSFSVSQ